MLPLLLIIITIIIPPVPFIENLLYARQQVLYILTNLILTTTPRMKYYCYPHFIDEDPGKAGLTCPLINKKQLKLLGFKPRQSDSRASALLALSRQDHGQNNYKILNRAIKSIVQMDSHMGDYE